MVERIPDKRDGFTLVEMMVTLAIIAFLGLTAVPLTQRMIHSADVEKASTQVMQTIAAARSLAMRNPGGITEDAAAIVRTVYDEEKDIWTLEVFWDEDEPESFVWFAELPVGVAISLGSEEGGSELRIDNRGRPLPLTLPEDEDEDEEDDEDERPFSYRISKGYETKTYSPF